MTEQMAIENIKALRDSEEIQEYYYADEFIESFDMAIKALEEIQEYRALGTVEELRVAKELYDSINKVEDDIWKLGMGCDDLRERIKQIYKQFRGKV